MSKRSSLHMLLVFLTAIAASVAMLIGWSDRPEDTSALKHSGSKTIQGKTTP